MTCSHKERNNSAAHVRFLIIGQWVVHIIIQSKITKRSLKEGRFTMYDMQPLGLFI